MGAGLLSRCTEPRDFRKEKATLSFQFLILDKRRPGMADISPNLPLLPGLSIIMWGPQERVSENHMVEQGLRSLCHLMSGTGNEDKGVPTKDPRHGLL